MPQGRQPISAANTHYPPQPFSKQLFLSFESFESESVNPRPGRKESDEGHGAGPQGGGLYHPFSCVLCSLLSSSSSGNVAIASHRQSVRSAHCEMHPRFPSLNPPRLSFPHHSQPHASGLPGTGVVSGFPRLSSPAPLPEWHG